ncbi:MAG: hypothetical protein IIC60_12300 [Proteobacteria bacterium]|nr:hypothetical protein [Pseudomonadota bacterium]
MGRANSSIAWGVFYQTVNIGGYFGVLIAIQMRQLSWDARFYVNAGMIMLNLLLLLVYEEPGKEERLALRAKIKAGEIKPPALWKEAILYQSHNIGQLWCVMATVGVMSAFGMYVYGRWTYRQAMA